MPASASNPRKRKLPPFGWRIVKTGLCVFLCLILQYLFSPQVALISSLAAIVTMQSSLDGTLKAGIGRAAGTALGGLAGMAMLPIAVQINIDWLYVLLMPIGMIFVIYLCIWMKIPGGVSICAYVYITVLVAPLNSEAGNPYIDALIRISDTIVGVAIALLVNRYIMPPKAKPLTDVSIPVNSFSAVYDHVRDELPHTEQLVLVDARLVNPDAVRTTPEMHITGISRNAAGTDTVSIPVPTNYKNLKYIDAVYVGPDYSISPFSLPQWDGYVSLPAEAYPVYLAWHVEEPAGKDTYGLIHHHDHDSEIKYGRVLRKAGRPVDGPLRTIRPADPRNPDQK